MALMATIGTFIIIAKNVAMDMNVVKGEHMEICKKCNLPIHEERVQHGDGHSQTKWLHDDYRKAWAVDEYGYAWNLHFAEPTCLEMKEE